MAGQQFSEWGQPLGPTVPGWHGAPPLPPSVLQGHYTRLEPLQYEIHGAELWRALAPENATGLWTYLPYGPFGSEEGFAQWVRERAQSHDLINFVICGRDGGRPLGMASYAHCDTSNGTVEIAGVIYSRSLRRSCAGTEALYLLIDQAFTLGYRRCEWSCDAMNVASIRAAERLGFVREGLFRQDKVVRGTNRDIAWYSIIDADWSESAKAVQGWLSASNFDDEGRQREPLTAYRSRPSPPEGPMHPADSAEAGS